MTDTQEAVKVLQTKIFVEEYYPRRWLDALIRHNLRPSDIESGTVDDKELLLLCHHMWEMLPDSKEIRRVPFFELCNLAERLFDDDDSEAAADA